MGPLLLPTSQQLQEPCSRSVFTAGTRSFAPDAENDLSVCASPPGFPLLNIIRKRIQSLSSDVYIFCIIYNTRLGRLLILGLE